MYKSNYNDLLHVDEYEYISESKFCMYVCIGNVVSNSIARKMRQSCQSLIASWLIGSTVCIIRTIYDSV